MTNKKKRRGGKRRRREEKGDDDVENGGGGVDEELTQVLDLEGWFPGCAANSWDDFCIGQESDLDGFERDVLDANPDANIDRRHRNDCNVLHLVVSSVQPSPCYRIVRKVVEMNPGALLDKHNGMTKMNCLNSYIKAQEWSECGQPESKTYLSVLEFLANSGPHMCLEYGVNEIHDSEHVVDIPLGQTLNEGAFKVLAGACPEAVPCLLYEMCNRSGSNYGCGGKWVELPGPLMGCALREAFLIQRRMLNTRILTCETTFWIPRNIDEEFFQSWLSSQDPVDDEGELKRQRILAWPDYMASLKEPPGGYYWESFNFGFNLKTSFDEDEEGGMTLLEACLGVADKCHIDFLIQCMHSLFRREEEITEKAPKKCLEEMVKEGWVENRLLTKYLKIAKSTNRKK